MVGVWRFFTVVAQAEERRRRPRRTAVLQGRTPPVRGRLLIPLSCFADALEKAIILVKIIDGPEAPCQGPGGMEKHKKAAAPLLPVRPVCDDFY